MNKKIINQIREKLESNADEKTKNSGKRFFKEEIRLYGVKTSIVSNIAKMLYKEINNYKKEEIFKICEEFWKSGFLEESFIACNLSYSLRAQYIESDFNIFESWVKKYVSNWASCDTLCNHSIGTFIVKYPSYVKKLIEWTNSKNRWVKRASAVTLIIPSKDGLFKNEIFEIADKLLLDKDDLVQKGYGWLLKVTCNKYQEDVFKYILSNKKIMPRTALRYAIEKMPENMKKEAMKR